MLKTYSWREMERGDALRDAAAIRAALRSTEGE